VVPRQNVSHLSSNHVPVGSPTVLWVVKTSSAGRLLPFHGSVKAGVGGGTPGRNESVFRAARLKPATTRLASLTATPVLIRP